MNPNLIPGGDTPDGWVRTAWYAGASKTAFLEETFHGISPSFMRDYVRRKFLGCGVQVSQRNDGTLLKIRLLPYHPEVRAGTVARLAPFTPVAPVGWCLRRTFGETGTPGGYVGLSVDVRPGAGERRWCVSATLEGGLTERTDCDYESIDTALEAAVEQETALAAKVERHITWVRMQQAIRQSGVPLS